MIEILFGEIIMKELTEEPIREARLIGDLLGKYCLSVSDWWFAKRIDQLIQDGKVRILEDCEQKYRRMIGKILIMS